MSVPRFTWDEPSVKSDPAAEPPVIISGVQGDAESHYERGYKDGYSQATADILRTIKEHYGK